MEYEMRISDWSSDVCSSDLGLRPHRRGRTGRAGLLMDLSLTEEQQAFRALARDFLDREAVPHRAQWDRDESVDLAILPKMAELGFFGLNTIGRASFSEIVCNYV